MKVLGNKRHLPKPIAVSTDRTKAQREQLNSVRAEVERMNGEKGSRCKTIRYVGGVPTIVDYFPPPQGSGGKGTPRSHPQGRKPPLNENTDLAILIKPPEVIDATARRDIIEAWTDSFPYQSKGPPSARKGLQLMNYLQVLLTELAPKLVGIDFKFIYDLNEGADGTLCSEKLKASWHADSKSLITQAEETVQRTAQKARKRGRKSNETSAQSGPDHTKLDAVLETVRDEQIDRYGEEWPYIIYCGELQNSTCFHAVYPGKTHYFNLAVDAIDFLSKFFLVTDYDWPPACGQVWSFLMKRGDRILDKGERQVSPASVNDLIGDLTAMLKVN
ncbi:hypothetical protein QAD02_002680 [Eretmocerus hayati]|uniref:Uncharacterized protein n=1 Tax=Eretmocerus hayati TaxID=131215 RepID=A0ACC2NK13_9HYME|nr:hypothetical protein QAD02_002680 [Eretmocerus hayati]